jgi:hypothetical protein
MRRAERAGQTSRDIRGEIADVYLAVIASEAKQSILSFFLLHDGLLRFARNEGRIPAYHSGCLKIKQVAIEMARTRHPRGR